MVGALTVSVFFSARTVLDWQAIQLWRIEWLLAAVAAFARRVPAEEVALSSPPSVLGS